MIWPIIRSKLISLAVQRVDVPIFNAVRDTADCFAEKGMIVGYVLLLFREALDDVYAADVEGLDYCAEGEEFEGCGVYHWGGWKWDVLSDMWFDRWKRGGLKIESRELVRDSCL